MAIDTQGFGKTVNEILILSMIREEPKHGYQIALEVEQRSGSVFELQHGTLYPILHRLERDGLVRGRWTGGGRRRKEYTLTDAGRRHLGEEGGRLRLAFDQLIRIIGEVDGEPLRPRPQAG
jgi:PadR family transcriptional regulator, regulatory protein PadR